MSSAISDTRVLECKTKKMVSVTREKIEKSREIWNFLLREVRNSGFETSTGRCGHGWDPSYSVPARIYKKEKIGFWRNLIFPGRTLARIHGFPEIMIYAFAEDWLPTTERFGEEFGVTNNNFIVKIAAGTKDEERISITHIFEKLRQNYGLDFQIESSSDVEAIEKKLPLVHLFGF